MDLFQSTFLMQIKWPLKTFFAFPRLQASTRKLSSRLVDFGHYGGGERGVGDGGWGGSVDPLKKKNL